MPGLELELNPVDFITIGTVGPKGRRVFHLQAGKEDQLATLIIEKEQARALSDAIQELIGDLEQRYPDLPRRNLGSPAMELHDPVEPLFRVAQMGLGYDEDRDLIVLVAQELVIVDEDTDPESVEPGVVRMWCSREQMQLLSSHALSIVQSGRPDPKQNGRLVYYWT
jgi:uncharacterized repeat protein (TIGR03847 family)